MKKAIEKSINILILFLWIYDYESEHMRIYYKDTTSESGDTLYPRGYHHYMAQILFHILVDINNIHVEIINT